MELFSPTFGIGFYLLLILVKLSLIFLLIVLIKKIFKRK